MMQLTRDEFPNYTNSSYSSMFKKKKRKKARGNLEPFENSSHNEGTKIIISTYF